MRLKRVSYLSMAAVLVASAVNAWAQQSPPNDQPLDYASAPEPVADEQQTDALDLYGFTNEPQVSDAQFDPTDPVHEAEDAPVQPDVVFEGVPEGVMTQDDLSQPPPQTAPPQVSAQDIQSGLLEALENDDSPLMPDEMADDAEFLGDDGFGAEPYTGENGEGPGYEFGAEGVVRPDDSLSSAASTGTDGVVQDGASGEAPLITEDETAGDPDRRVMLSRAGARIRTLDKISGEAQDIDVSVGSSVSHMGVDITVRACYQTPPEDLPPESVAYVEVISNRLNVTSGTAAETDPRIFSGWMFASSPGLNAMEHPIYDVWVTNCIASLPESE